MLTSKLRMSLLCVLMLALAAGMAAAAPILLVSQGEGSGLPTDKILKYSLDGTYLGEFATGINEVGSLIQAPTGDIYVSEYSGGKVDRFDINGNLLASVTQSGGPAALAWLNGQLYVNTVTGMKVVGYNPDLTAGTYTHVWSEYTGTYSTALTAGPDGKLYGGQYGLCTFAAWTPGEATHSTYVTMPNGESPATGAWYNGILYTSTYAGNIYKVPAADQAQALFSTTNPYGLTVYDGKIYVSGWRGASPGVIEVYGLDGVLLSSFATVKYNRAIAVVDLVPEPSSLLALAMGGFGLLGALRRSRK